MTKHRITATVAAALVSTVLAGFTLAGGAIASTPLSNNTVLSSDTVLDDGALGIAASFDVPVEALDHTEPVTADITMLRASEAPIESMPTTTTAPPPPPPTTAPPPPPPPPPPPAGGPAAVIHEIFGPNGDAAVAIARCESGLNPAAMSPGGGNHGLFQINNVHSGRFESVTGSPWSARYDSRANTVYAKWLFDQSGWGPWACNRVL